MYPGKGSGCSTRQCYKWVRVRSTATDANQEIWIAHREDLSQERNQMYNDNTGGTPEGHSLTDVCHSTKAAGLRNGSRGTFEPETLGV
jgi:hypothetical protein